MVKASPVKQVGKPLRLDQSRLTTLVEAATLAPSGGNNQPWQWLYQAGYLYLFHDQSKASLFDFEHRAAYVALGAATENLVLQARVFPTCRRSIPMPVFSAIPSLLATRRVKRR